MTTLYHNVLFDVKKNRGQKMPSRASDPTADMKTLPFRELFLEFQKVDCQTTSENQPAQ